MWVKTDLAGEFGAKRLTPEDLAGEIVADDRRVPR